MSRDLSLKIHQFWQEKAKAFKVAPDASWGDLLMRKEIDIIDLYLSNGDEVLDLGCANGYSTIELAKRKKINILGIDYSKSMILQANNAKRKLNGAIQKRISFKLGNILKLTFGKGVFDKVNSTRCFCNLTRWEDQATALMQIWKVLKPGGILLLSEPTIQGLKNLNKIGEKFGLDPLSQPWHNLYVDEDKLKRFIKPYFNLEINYFSSSYYLLSRIVYRWFMKDDINKLKRDSLFNKIGLKLPAFGKWGIQRLYILKKKT